MRYMMVVAGGIMLAFPAVAQTGGEPTDAVLRCRVVIASADRLACFDRTSAALQAASRDGNIVVVDRRQVTERRRKRFGLAGANALATSDVRGADVKELTSTIRTVLPSSVPNRFDLRLADGSIWQTVDTVKPPRDGAAIVVARSTLGGYRARVGKLAFLVKRLR